MQRAIGMVAVLAVLGLVGGAVLSLADSPEPIWSTDTAPPSPPVSKAAPCPKAKPYDSPIWSTDTVPPATCEQMSAPSPPKETDKDDDMIKEAPKKSLLPCSQVKPYTGEIWSTDTVEVTPCRKEAVAASVPKVKPYDGPVWSTDSR